jgi:hypothetical protein
MLFRLVRDPGKPSPGPASLFAELTRFPSAKAQDDLSPTRLRLLSVTESIALPPDPKGAAPCKIIVPTSSVSTRLSIPLEPNFCTITLTMPPPLKRPNNSLTATTLSFGTATDSWADSPRPPDLNHHVYRKVTLIPWRVLCRH